MQHAYGPAEDTPRHLAALRGDDPGAVRQALEHLDVAVLHQGYPYPAAAPVVRVVAGQLDEMAGEPGVRRRLLGFLGRAAEAAFAMEHGDYDRDPLPELHGALVATRPSVDAYLDADDPDLRTSATAAAVSYARCAPLRDRRPALGELLRRRIADGEKRAWHVARLIDVGGPVADYLDDPEHDVRVTAALAPELAGDAKATEILIAALPDADVPVPPARDALLEYANSLVERNPWRGYTLAELIAAVTGRVRDFERIAEPAARLVRTASWTGADRTWGPLMRAAFPGGYRADASLTRAQRLMVRALLDNPELWRPNDGNAYLAFKQAGLPRDRDRCRQILDAA